MWSIRGSKTNEILSGSCWKALALTDLVFKSIACVLLAPLVAMLFRLFVAISGHDVLADFDIASFLIHPIGWMCCIVAGGTAVGLMALEQSALLLIAAAARAGRQLTGRQVLGFTFRRSHTIIQMTVRMVVLTLVAAAPFLAIGAALYFALLTKYDINFYLATKPLVFWLAAFSIGAVMTVMMTVLLRLITSWLLALPILLFEGASAAEAMRRSRVRAKGHRMRYLLWIAVWFAANSFLSTLATGLILWAGAAVLSVGFNSSWQLSLIVGAILLFWSIVQVVTNLLGT
jgi:glycerophosphoryl diester phosphodiesterase